MRSSVVIALLGLGLGLATSPAAAKPKKKRTPRALVLVIDRSGSMQGPKLDAAKSAALAAVDAMKPDDQVSIITFDTESTVFVPLQRAGNRQQIADTVARLVSGGGTNLVPGLADALAVVRDSKTRSRHVILLSDGESPSDGLDDVLTQMTDAKITVSAVGVAGADQHMLQKIVEAGHGRLYAVDDLQALPKVFVEDVRVAMK